MNLLSLSVFQQALLLVVVLLFVGSVVALYKGWTGRREGFIWLAVWLAAGVAVLWPEATSRVARALGIGRGADLVFYCAVVIMLIGFWTIYIRLRRVRSDITALVRHLALQDAEREASTLTHLADSTPPAEHDAAAGTETGTLTPSDPRQS